MVNNKIRIAIFGGSGYGGSELLRILLFHPNAEIRIVTANGHCGKPVSTVHRNLLGLTELKFEQIEPEGIEPDSLDLAFFSLPHGQAMQLFPKLPAGVRAIDLSGDFRLRDHAEFRKFYGFEHSATESQKQFIYGLTETNRRAIADAEKIANPGCFATATLLALAPLVEHDLIRGKVIIDAKTGSSGSGAKTAANTHHPQRVNSFYAYKPFSHQHLPEIVQHLKTIGDFQNEMVFMAHSLPVSRGIFSSCYVEMKSAHSSEELREIYKNFYSDSFFVRIVEGSPDINWVKNTNFCDIGVFSSGQNAVVFAALDNLVKGAAGQAVQNMNLMFGLEENTGLIFPGAHP